MRYWETTVFHILDEVFHILDKVVTSTAPRILHRGLVRYEFLMYETVDVDPRLTKSRMYMQPRPDSFGQFLWARKSEEK